jgi:hypothetical protein
LASLAHAKIQADSRAQRLLRLGEGMEPEIKIQGGTQMSNDLHVPRAFQAPGAASEISSDLGDEATPAQNPPQAITIEIGLATKLSLADFQNAVPLIRELTLSSTLKDDSGQLELSLTSTPAFVKPKTWRLDSIKPGARYQIRDLDVQLDGPLLTRLTEAETVTVTLSVRPAGGGGDPIAELFRPVELLPRNQWGGLSHLPDMVAAFVQPNDPAVDKVLKKVAELLRDHGKDAALDGYKQGGPKRAWELAGAAWGAVTSMKLDYALPPASFEHQGQKFGGRPRLRTLGWAPAWI